MAPGQSQAVNISEELSARAEVDHSATLWAKAQHEGAFHPRASSAKTRGFHTQLDKGPETP